MWRRKKIYKDDDEIYRFENVYISHHVNVIQISKADDMNECYAHQFICIILSTSIHPFQESDKEASLRLSEIRIALMISYTNSRTTSFPFFEIFFCFIYFPPFCITSTE